MSALRSNITEIASVFRSMQEARDKPRKETTESGCTLAEDKTEHKWVIRKPSMADIKASLLK